MKKLYVLFAFCIAYASGITAAEQGNNEFIHQETSSRLWFRCDPTTKTATVIADQSKLKTDYDYITEELVIPYSIKISNASLGTQGGGTESETEFLVTAIDEDAFTDLAASKLRFAVNSQVRTIGKKAFYNAWFAGTITLPDSLQRIEPKAFAIYSEGYSTHITKVVIPASLDSLCLSAIVLDAVDVIEFLGTVPPRCQVLPEATGTAYNPWTQADTDNPATPKTISIKIPEGTYDAYKNCEGIGDYFTCFTNPQGTVTGMEQPAMRQPATKTVRDGKLIIQHKGVTYSVTGERILN